MNLAASERRPAAFRRFARQAARALTRALLRVAVSGAEHVPSSGALLVTMNHLGGADPILLLGFMPRDLAFIGKQEIMRWPVLGWLARTYGMIPVRRGEVDRAALKAALAVLRSGQTLLIAPEGRESKTQALEAGKGGAAFLALLSQATILPVAITGTEWGHVLSHWRKLRRPYVTLTFGRPYTLPEGVQRRDVADLIMRRIAEMLPPDYQGVYAAQ